MRANLVPAKMGIEIGHPIGPGAPEAGERLRALSRVTALAAVANLVLAVLKGTAG